MRAQLLASENARANSDLALVNANAALQQAALQLEQLKRAGGVTRGKLNHPAGQLVGQPSSRGTGAQIYPLFRMSLTAGVGEAPPLILGPRGGRSPATKKASVRQRHSSGVNSIAQTDPAEAQVMKREVASLREQLLGGSGGDGRSVSSEGRNRSSVGIGGSPLNRPRTADNGAGAFTAPPEAALSHSSRVLYRVSSEGSIGSTGVPTI